jgi:outer membrane protein assembly factor BamB
MRFLALPILLASLAPLAAADWPHFRGPGMQGHSDDARAPLEWSETKNLLWSLDLPGDGHSSPIVAGGRVYLTGAKGNGRERLVFCVDAHSGKLLWSQVAAKDQPEEKTHPWHGYASPSCAVDGKHVYSFFGTAGLFCHTVDGEKVWHKSFGRIISDKGWGYAASPVLHKGLVIMNCDTASGPGAAPANLVALDKATGKQVWSTPRNQGQGFGTPLFLKAAGGRVDLALNGPEGLWGYDPDTGKERWRILRRDSSGQGQFGEPLPVSDGQRLFILSGRTGPFQVVRLPDKGDVTKSNMVYTEKRGKRDVASPILVDGRVYCLDKGSHLTVFDMKSGKTLSKANVGGGANSMASPVYVRGKILWVLGNGTTLVVEPGDTPKVVARNRLPGDSLDYGASPAVVDGRIYIRSRSKLYCIGEK